MGSTCTLGSSTATQMQFTLPDESERGIIGRMADLRTENKRFLEELQQRPSDLDEKIEALEIKGQVRQKHREYNFSETTEGSHIVRSFFVRSKTDKRPKKYNTADSLVSGQEGKSPANSFESKGEKHVQWSDKNSVKSILKTERSKSNQKITSHPPDAPKVQFAQGTNFEQHSHRSRHLHQMSMY